MGYHSTFASILPHRQKQFSPTLHTTHTMAPPTISLNFGEGAPVKSSSFNGGLFINNEFVEGEGGKTIEVVNPTTGDVIGQVSEASPKDVDRAVEAAQKAYDTVWGLKCSGAERAKYMIKLAEA